MLTMMLQAWQIFYCKGIFLDFSNNYICQLCWWRKLNASPQKIGKTLSSREVRDAGKGGCEKGDRKCERQKKRKERKKLRKQKKRNKKSGKKVKKSQTKNGKNGAKKGRKGKGKKLARKLKGNKKQQQDTEEKQKKQTSNKKKGTKKKSRKDKRVKKVKGSRSSSTSGSGRFDQIYLIISFPYLDIIIQQNIISIPLLTSNYHIIKRVALHQSYCKDQLFCDYYDYQCNNHHQWRVSNIAQR